MFGMDQPWVKRLAQVGSGIGMDFTMKFDRMPYTVIAHTLLEYIKKEHGLQKQNDVQEAIFKSLFTDGICPDTPEVLAKIATEAGLDADIVKAVVSDGNNIKKTKEKAYEWSSAGISGVPHFFLNGYSAFSGALDPEQICKYFKVVATKDSVELPVKTDS